MEPQHHRRVRRLLNHLATCAAGPLSAAAPTSAAVEAPQRGAPEDSSGLLSDVDVAAFVRDGFIVLPNLVDAGDIAQETCDAIHDLGYAQRAQPGHEGWTAGSMGEGRTKFFRDISPHLNAVMASPTVRGGLQSLLGPGYFMTCWNTHLHVNPGPDGSFHADGTDHGPSHSTVRDQRSRQIFGFFYPADVPLENGRARSPHPRPATPPRQLTASCRRQPPRSSPARTCPPSTAWTPPPTCTQLPPRTASSAAPRQPRRSRAMRKLRTRRACVRQRTCSARSLMR